VYIHQRIREKIKEKYAEEEERGKE